MDVLEQEDCHSFWNVSARLESVGGPRRDFLLPLHSELELMTRLDLGVSICVWYSSLLGGLLRCCELLEPWRAGNQLPEANVF